MLAGMCITHRLHRLNTPGMEAAGAGAFVGCGGLMRCWELC